MAQVIIFDFDGTIADSLDLMVHSYNIAAHTYGCKAIADADISQMRHMHLRDVLYFLKIPYLKLPFLLFSTLGNYKKQVSTVSIFQDIPTMLCDLMVAGYSLYIVSTNAPDTIKLFLKEHNIEFFDGIYSCGSHMFGKGSVIKKLLRDEGIAADNAMYIGDELRDIDAARQTGITSIAVSWGFNAREKLQEKQPDILVDTPKELADHLI